MRRVLVALLFVSGLVACKTSEPSGQPVETCTRSCEARASRQCSSDECVRGCEFILDRIVEREADKVISCVAKAPRRCADVVWAECAASIGPHLDGGPPAPQPPPEDWE